MTSLALACSNTPPLRPADLLFRLAVTLLMSVLVLLLHRAPR